MEAVGRAVVGAAGTAGLARAPVVRVRVDSVVKEASEVARVAGAEAMDPAVAAVEGGMRSGPAGQASVSSPS
jgi:hypothetical protein